MKSERRHELRENELADSVEQLSERLRPYVTPILSIAIGALVLVLVGLFVSSRWEASRSESWDTCLSALVTGDQKVSGRSFSVIPALPLHSGLNLFC